jgi:UDP-N-acetyl-D-mannosaminuronic acid dehydrogenase
VLGVDVAQHVVETVNAGNIHIEEPGLHTVVLAAIQSGNLRAAEEPEPADVFIIAVPTPLTPEKRADMRFVVRAAESIVPHLRPGNLVILESTSPPGTCLTLLQPILERGGLLVGRDLHLAHCPERVLPGKILREQIENDRIIGGYDHASAERAKAVYASFVEGRIFLTDTTTAEMVKLLENTYRDVNIALANETALLCERLGVDFWEVAQYANRHPRVHVHSAGPGVGGHCISVDPWFLVEAAPDVAQLIRLARERNDGMPAVVVARLRELLAGVARPKVAALGLAYKANVDDTRESPAVHVVALLREAGVEVAVYDPHVAAEATTLEACVTGADCLVLLTDHDEYRGLSPAMVGERMRRRVVLDTRNAVDAQRWREAQFTVHRLGCGRDAAAN